MLTREKAMLASFSPVHNGPLTRARQAPSNMPSAADGVKSELLNNVVGTDGEKPKEEEERNKAIREWEAKIEADFEAIRSRDTNVHVVPNHCGKILLSLSLQGKWEITIDEKVQNDKHDINLEGVKEIEGSPKDLSSTKDGTRSRL